MTFNSSFRLIITVNALWIFHAANSFTPTSSTINLDIRGGTSNRNSKSSLKNTLTKGTTTASTSTTTTTQPPKKDTPKTAIIVGCGPAGLASSLILARNHNYSKVTILEYNSYEQIASYERSKSYYYLINERGQTLTKQFPSLQRSIEENGVGITKFEVTDVPADLKDVYTGIPTSREQTEEDKKRFGNSYWIPRHMLIKCMLEEVKDDANIEVMFNARCGDINALSADEEHGPVTGEREGFQVDILRENGDGSAHDIITRNANLVVGADGLRSTVREQLYNNPARFANWSNYDQKNFFLRTYHSPSSGLRIKTLQIESNFTIPVGGVDDDDTTNRSTSTKSVSSNSYRLQSVNRGSTNQVRISLIPVKDSNALRPAAICTLPNHDIWKIQTGSEMKTFFSNAFPRFDFGLGGDDSLVAEGEWEEFAKAQGTVFPPCQYTRGAVAYDERRDAGIVLVGDALHAFPPDLGQGVNAALRDVAVLDESLRTESGRNDSGDDGNDSTDGVKQHPSTSNPYFKLGLALDKFQTRQGGGETKALIKLARFGAPFQYGQSSRSMIFRKYLWTFNIVVRVLLNKVIGTPKPAVIAMMDPSLKFQTIMRRSDRLTAALWSITAVVVGLLVKGLRMRFVVG